MNQNKNNNNSVIAIMSCLFNFLIGGIFLVVQFPHSIMGIIGSILISFSLIVSGLIFIISFT